MKKKKGNEEILLKVRPMRKKRRGSDWSTGRGGREEGGKKRGR